MLHDRDKALSLAAKIVVMESGGIQKIGTVREITEYLYSNFVTEFSILIIYKELWVSLGF